MLRCKSYLLLMAASFSALGCTGPEANGTGTEEIVDVAPTRVALHKNAATAANEIDGYCERGIGVYLSAANDTAELTVYTITPAQVATFEQPTLQLTFEREGERVTESVAFEDVTLEAGESRSFSAPAGGTLLDVSAEVVAQ